VAGANAQQRAALLRHQEHLLDELNVKALELLDGDSQMYGAPSVGAQPGQPQGVSLQRYRVKPNLRLLGPRLGKGLPALRAALDALDGPAAAAVARAVEAGQTVTLPLGDTTIQVAPAELLVESAPLEGYAVAQEGALQVALDTSLDDVLRREGLARDLVRAVQESRKAAGLALSDRITLYLVGGDTLDRVLGEWGDYILDETLAQALVTSEPLPGVYAETVALDGADVLLGVARRG
jgi:isoleucyl-tRNA synthetase